MLVQPDIASRVIDLIAKSKSLAPETITPATTFDELNIDSLDKINLSFEVEEIFAIEIPDDSLNSLRTVGDVIAGVHRLQAEQQASA
jgi:acyl carrier protein